MKFIAAIAALAVAAVANAQYTFTSCATGATDMTVSSLTLNPYPLCVGKNVCATVSGDLNTAITAGAKLNVVGKYLNRVVYTDAQDLCTVLGASGHPCPVPTSVKQVNACILVKSSAPADVPVALQLTATNGNGHVLFCQQATVTAKKC
ncbi:hypothetical protein EDD11_006170 [Mortierella claussenii]|nr:hypothetical protein EDD11_006170 [Mortierella claussenii]